MQRTQTRLRMGFGLVAMMAVLALVAVMTMVNSNGGITSASTGDPDPDFTVLAKASNPVGTDPITVDIIKEAGRKILAGDVVLYNGLRWNVTERNYTNPTPTPFATPSDESAGPGSVTLVGLPCAKQNAANYPQDDKWIYQSKPCDDGNISGVYDLEVFGNFPIEFGGGNLFHCISRTDHDSKTNAIKTSQQCFSNYDAGDPANVLSQVNPPGEGPDYADPPTNLDNIFGPPPPPPYPIAAPWKSVGFYYPNGDVSCDLVGTTPCLVTIACVPELGAGSLGPNLAIRNVLFNPMSDPSTGFIQLAAGQSIEDCESFSGAGLPAVDPTTPFVITSTKAAIGGPFGRTSATDFDGDGCSDSDELAKPGAIPKGCGDDPWNPTDSNQTDFAGAYDILITVLRAEATPGFGGIYFSCLADIQQTGTGKIDGNLQARAFCYTDSFVSVVNNLGYPGVTGDGFPGGSPPFGAIPPCENSAPFDCGEQFRADEETICNRGLAGTSLDEDGDTVINDGCPSEGFGDVDSKHTVLTGFVDNSDNTLKLRGCFEDEDASSSVGTVYAELTVNKNTGQGTVDIWTWQSAALCNTPTAFGSYSGDWDGINPPVDPGCPCPDPAGVFNDAKAEIVRQPGDKSRDTDQDGIPNATELRDMDDPLSSANNCGGRDPGNPYDWYDVNQDGVIDLVNDILGTIEHWQPLAGGNPPYDIGWDRPPTMIGGFGHWNRGEPDGIIDLVNDILGVIDQWHPLSCG